MGSEGNSIGAIVLGVHRSGTSALAGVLTRLGFHPGSELLPAVPGVNNNGFFEDQRVVALNDAILAALGRDWRYPTELPVDWQARRELDDIRAEIRDFLEEHRQAPLWLLKDPRLCQLLPLWLEELHNVEPTALAQGRLRILLSVRDVREVAGSLQRRDKLGTDVAEQLWVTHLLASERHSRKHSRLFIRYDDLLSNATGTIEQIVEWLEFPASAAEAAAAFVSPAERNQRAPELPAPQSPMATAVNSFFMSLHGGAQVLDAADVRETLDAFNRQLSAGAVLQPSLDAQTALLAKVEGDFGEAMEQLEAHRLATAAYEANALKHEENAQAQYEEAVRLSDALETHTAQVRELQAELNLARENLVSEQAAHAEFRARALKVLGSQVLPPAEPGTTSTPNNYRGSIDLRVENNAHTRVIRYLRETLTTDTAVVLEVGCSEGYFGAALKADGHQVWGIETNPAAADQASAVLDFVYRESIEAFLLADEHKNERFDAVVFGDVLEHLLNPAAVLRAVGERLNTGGVVVASVPNVAHERVRMMLLEGRWDYSATGIMDRTHLHFFTRDSLVDLFSSAGLRVKRLSPIELEGHELEIPVSPTTQSAVAPIISDRERNVFQFVVMAEPDANGTMDVTSANAGFKLRTQHQLLCMPPAPDSSLYSIRIGDPLKRQNELFGGEVRTAPFGAPDQDAVDWADTVVLQREVTAEQIEMVRSLQAQGKRVIFDIDDYLVEVPTYLSVYDHCVQMRPHLEQMLQLVDAVTVSTAPLRDRLLDFNQNVFLTPNYAWSNLQPIQHSDDLASTEHKRVRIIVASSDSVRVDFLLPALRQIVESHDVELVGIGPPGEFLQAAGLPIKTSALLRHEHFKQYAASRDDTIALIPLDDNPFSNCKSAIKFFDYALAGVPCICSDVEPYRSVVEHNVTGVLCPASDEAWVASIATMIDDTSQRRQFAEAAQRMVLAEHNLNQTAAAWQDVITAVHKRPDDPLYPSSDDHPTTTVQRSASELLRGTLRHAMRPASWKSVWRIYKKEGLRGLLAQWKLVF